MPNLNKSTIFYDYDPRPFKLVNTLNELFQVEAGWLKAVFEPTDLALLTAQLASLFRPAVEQAGLRFVLDCPPLPQQIYVDRGMWEKIVLNLISNAFKFTLEGKIAVSLRWRNERVELEVSDTGTGIPEEELRYLFECHRQVRGTHKGNRSGLGLAFVQELVWLHAGTVCADSVVGQGSTFTVTIPAGSVTLSTW